MPLAVLGSTRAALMRSTRSWMSQALFLCAKRGVGPLLEKAESLSPCRQGRLPLARCGRRGRPGRRGGQTWRDHVTGAFMGFRMAGQVRWHSVIARHGVGAARPRGKFMGEARGLYRPGWLAQRCRARREEPAVEIPHAACDDFPSHSIATLETFKGEQS